MADISNGPRDELDADNGSGEEPTRVCPHCATVSHTAGDYCPQCGKSLIKKPRLSKRARVGLGVGLLVLLIGAAGAAVEIKHHEDEESKKKHAATLVAARHRQEQSETAKREAEDEQRVKRESEESERRSNEKELERGVEKDAKKLVSEETLSEPILGATCSPASGGSSTELKSSTGTYDCIAITKHESGGGVSGYRFSATINFADGSFTYHLGN
jgi:hypothetical protein